MSALLNIMDACLQPVVAGLRLLYFMLMKILYVYFRVAYAMEVEGRVNIPEGGAIFLVNHQSMLDGYLFLAAFQKPVAVFGEVGNKPINALLVRFLHWVPRRGTRESMVDKMVNVILYRNRYFAIWPEGTLERGAGQMHGFSSIVRVYTIVNCDTDRIPFVPVYMESDPAARGARKIRIEFLPKIYIPRSWLKVPAQGGKSPREIIDTVLLVLARHRGQLHLSHNPVLERRRKTYGTSWK